VIAAQTPASGRRDPTSLRVDDPLEARQTTPTGLSTDDEHWPRRQETRLLDRF